MKIDIEIQNKLLRTERKKAFKTMNTNICQA